MHLGIRVHFNELNDSRSRIVQKAGDHGKRSLHTKRNRFDGEEADGTNREQTETCGDEALRR